MLEPVEKFVREGMRAANGCEWRVLRQRASIASKKDGKSGDTGRRKRVWFVKGGLQDCDPMYPGRGGEGLGLAGAARGGEGAGFGDADGEVAYDA